MKKSPLLLLVGALMIVSVFFYLRFYNKDSDQKSEKPIKPLKKVDVQISAGLLHTCALNKRGNVFCWGDNNNGRLGDGTTEYRSFPTEIPFSGILRNEPVTSISAGGQHSCALGDGLPICWGNNNFGQLGNRSTADSLFPMFVDTTTLLNNKKITLLSAGYFNSCVVDSEGEVFCWGPNGMGQLGNNKNESFSSIPVKVNKENFIKEKTTTSLSVGYYHTCAVNNSGKIYCWGMNNKGQLGDGTTENRLIPVAVDPEGILSKKTISSVSAGKEHTCAVDSEGALFCWGSNESGQLGTGKIKEKTVTEEKIITKAVPVDNTGVLNNQKIIHVTSGGNHTCALDDAGKVYCWGANGKGQLGDGTVDQRDAPVEITSNIAAKDKIVSLSAGWEHTCAADDKENFFCWGSNTSGQLGTGARGSEEKSLLPVQVKW